MTRLRSGIRWKLMTAGALVLIVALVLAGSYTGGLVGAQSSTGTPAAGSAATSTPTAQYPAIVNELAKQLGIDPAKVEAALQQVIGQGKLNGLFGRGGIFGGRFFGRGRGPIVIVRGRGISGAAAAALQSELSKLATFYGETSASLRSELAQGMTLAQIAQKHGKTVDQLKTFLTQQFQSDLDTLINHSFAPKRVAPATTPAAPATPAAAGTPTM